MVSRITIVTLLVTATFVAVTSGAWANGSDPNKPVDVANGAMDVTDIVNPPAPQPQSDEAAVTRAKALEAKQVGRDETEEAGRVIVRGKKVDTMNVGTLNVDRLNIKGAGRKVSAKPRVSIRPQRARLSRSDQAKINKASHDAERATNDADEAKVAAARAKADALLAKNDSANAKARSIAAAKQAAQAKKDSNRALTIADDTNEKLGKRDIAWALVAIIAILALAHSIRTSRRLDGAIDASRRLAERVVTFGQQLTEFIASHAAGGGA